MANKVLSFVIPAYNEEKTLMELVNKVLEVTLPEGFEKEIIIVNDSSKDKTGEIINDLGKKYNFVKPVHHSNGNWGKSQTVRDGISHTTGDYVVIQDADLEYEPQEIADLLNLLLEKDLDVVYGNRFGRKNKIIYWQNYI